MVTDRDDWCRGCAHLEQGRGRSAGYVSCRLNALCIDCDARAWLDGRPRTLPRRGTNGPWIRLDAAMTNEHCGYHTAESGGPRGWGADRTEPLEWSERTSTSDPRRVESWRKSRARKRERQREAAEKSPWIHCPRGCGRLVKVLTNSGKPTQSCAHCRRKGA